MLGVGVGALGGTLKVLGSGSESIGLGGVKAPSMPQLRPVKMTGLAKRGLCGELRKKDILLFRSSESSTG